MDITLEISYYPLGENFEEQVSEFILKLSEHKNIRVQTGLMSSLVTGEYNNVLGALQNAMQPFLEKYPSVFNISISNSCGNCKVVF